MGLKYEPPFDPVKDLKDHFRARLRVTPEIVTDSVENVSNVNFPPMTRKPITFFDNRKQLF